MAQVNADSAGQLDLYFRVARASVAKTLDFFNEDDEAYSLAGLTFQMLFKRKPGDADEDAVLVLEDGDGLTVGASSIIFQLDEDQSDIPVNMYYWELKETTTVRTWLCRNAHFIDRDPVGLTDTTEVTVNLAGDTIRVTITTGSASGGSADDIDDGSL